jgi:hypothetical protein
VFISHIAFHIVSIVSGTVLKTSLATLVKPFKASQLAPVAFTISLLAKSISFAKSKTVLAAKTQANTHHNLIACAFKLSIAPHKEKILFQFSFIVLLV